jgi:hypothetical protein
MRMDTSGIPVNIRQNMSGIIMAIYIPSLKMINCMTLEMGAKGDKTHLTARNKTKEDSAHGIKCNGVNPQS